jgi:hypothetical protein
MFQTWVLAARSKEFSASWDRIARSIGPTLTGRVRITRSPSFSTELVSSSPMRTGG